MRYATLCSGIEGFGLGFDRAGMECVFQCEANKQALSVLRRHYPKVPKTEDVNDDRTESELVRLRPDVIAFGSPCQDLSVAGKRGGLAGKRSGLFFRCVELCFACEAERVVWENVPGVFSSAKGQDFASVLEAFTGFRPTVPKEGWCDTGVCVGPLYSVTWAVLDSQWFGLAQRRSRVFLVADFGKRGRPYEVLSLGESLPWNLAPSREAGEIAPQSIAPSLSASGRGTSRSGESRGQDCVIPMGEEHTHTQQPTCHTNDVAKALTTGGYFDGETETFIADDYIAGAKQGVRRLLPVECERLQGFPDGWTEPLSDSARYRVLGNAVSVPVAMWIGKRIMAVN